MNEQHDHLMRSSRPSASGRIWIGILVGVALGVGPSGWSAEQPAQEAVAAPESAEAIVENLTLQIPQSVFIDRQDAGIKDPFFPESSRAWNGDDSKVTPVALPIAVKIEKLVFLRGITGQAGDRVALLNNQTFKEGDTVNLKLRDGTLLKVTMVTILDTSVEFTVEGQTETCTKQLED